MNDSILLLADMRRFEPNELDHTIEGALMHGQPPLLNCRGDLHQTEFLRRVLAIGRQYLVDYDLVRAAARAGIEWEMVRYLERDPTFITAIDMMRRELTPEEITTKTEIMELLKREATTAAKSRDRVAALKELSRIAGYTLGENGPSSGNSAPVINITLNGASPDRPMINVTTAPKALAKGDELL